MKWGSIPVIVGVVLAGFLAQKIFGEDSGDGRLLTPRPAAAIGSGEDAVAVSPEGVLMRWLTIPEGVELPLLPISEPPDKARLSGPLLEQARVLGAAPQALRPYLASSSYGESGVVVQLSSGIELRFGSSSRAEAKWQAAATTLADPSVIALDYVNLHAPNNVSIGGSGHALPALP